MGDKFYAQSVATLRYVCNVHGFTPKDFDDQYAVDCVVDAVWFDILNPVLATSFGPGEDAEKAEKINAHLEKRMPIFMEAIERRLKANKTQTHIVGEHWTAADFTMLHLWTGVINGKRLGSHFEKFKDTYPIAKGYFESMAEDMKDYLSKRPQDFTI